MKDVRKREESEYSELNSKQVKILLDFANMGKRDVFYDLGSGTGRIVLEAVRQTSVRKAVGIEAEREYHEKARQSAINLLSKKDLKRIDFWLGEFGNENAGCYDYDVSDATVVYSSLNEHEEDTDYYKQQFKKKRVKIITKDLPLVGYESIANREQGDCWFFLMRYPFRRVRSKRRWIRSVLGKDSTMKDVHAYYRKQLTNREINRKDAIDSLLDLKKLVNKRF